MSKNLWIAVALAATAMTAQGANVLVLTSGDGPTDEAIRAALVAGGHTVTMGPVMQTYDGTPDLAPFDVVIPLDNANWTGGAMTDAGQSALADWLAAGGGMVTGEWFGYYVLVGYFPPIEPFMPFTGNLSYDSLLDDVYTIGVADVTLNEGLPDEFGFPLFSYAGTETVVTPKDSATVFYSSLNVGAGLIGWDHDGARVISFTSTIGPDQVNDTEFGRLLSNAVEWAAGRAGPCYPDFTGEGALDLFDFLAYVNSFNAGEDVADCTDDGVLDLFDFLCFVNAFNAGC